MVTASQKPSGHLILEQLSKKFYVNGESFAAVNEVSIEALPGDFITFIGRSGCGKTTILRLVAGLETPTSGKVVLDGEIVTKPGIDRGYMFQNSSLYPWLTIEKNIAFGLRAQNKYREYKDNGEVRRWLRAMGLDGFENALPGQLSGGMTQRAALARSLILRPKILLLDEPLGALDAFTRGEMQNVVRDVWERQGITVLMVSHDVDEAIFLSAKIVVLTKSPCEVKEVIINNLRGESDRTSPEYLTSRSHILSSLNEYG